MYSFNELGSRNSIRPIGPVVENMQSYFFLLGREVERACAKTQKFFS